jgi:hypothetical protein
MRIINNDVMQLDLTFRHPDFSSLFISCHVELEKGDYYVNGDYNWKNICSKLWQYYNGNSRLQDICGNYFYHEMEVEYHFYADDSVLIKKFVYDGYEVEKISSYFRYFE